MCFASNNNNELRSQISAKWYESEEPTDFSRSSLKWPWTTHLTKLSGGNFLLEETSSGVKECLVWAVRYELLSFMNVHVMSSARWRHNPRAVAEQFSLALGLQRRDTLKGIIQPLLAASTSSPFFFFLPPNDDREQLLQVMLWIFNGKFIFFGWEEEASARKSRFGWDGSVCVEGPGVSVIFNVLCSFDSAPLLCTVGDLSATCYMIHGQDVNYWRLYQWTHWLHFDLLRLLYPVCQQCRNRGGLIPHNNLIPRQDVFCSNSVAPSEIEHFRQPQCYSSCFDKYIFTFL